jgi:phosphoglucosamine mutase
MSLFGTSGIRRKADRGLIELGLQVGLAVGSRYKSVIIACDTRTSSAALSHSVVSGLLAAGTEVHNAGVLPTPTLAYAARQFDAGIMITASHNPPEYNGIKILNQDGSAFSQEQQKEIEDSISGATLKIDWSKMSEPKIYQDAESHHIFRIKQDIPDQVKIRVVVDAGCGAAYSITPRLLSELGCEVIPLNCRPNGFFPHDVEPVEANLGELMKTVKETGAALGIAHDGDADRMMAVDDKGHFISGDVMLAILALESGEQRIVTTLDASMSIENFCFEIVRTKVGDPYVSEALKNGRGFGGEPSGAWVFPSVSLCPDGIYAAAKIAAIAGRTNLSDLIESIPTFPMIRGHIPLDGLKIENLREGLLTRFNPRSIQTLEGLKLTFEDGWLFVRPSGTEPKLRVTAEASTEVHAREVFEEAIKIINNLQQVKK